MTLKRLCHRLIADYYIYQGNEGQQEKVLIIKTSNFQREFERFENTPL